MLEDATDKPPGMGLKRPRSDDSSPASRGPKRRETEVGYDDQYTEEELNALERAAAILGTSLADLLASNHSKTDITPTDTDTSISNTSSSDSLPSDEIVPFNLKLPDFSKRASASGKPNSFFSPPNPQDEIASNGSECSVLPWLSSFPADLEQRPRLSDEIGIQEQLSYNDWELNLYNNPQIWEELGFDNFAFDNASSPVLLERTCYDEAFASPSLTTDSSTFMPSSMPSLGQLITSQVNTQGTQSPNTTTGDGIDTPQTPSPSAKSRKTLQSTLTKSKRRGPFQDLRERQETGLTRKAKACLRCRMQRIRCRPDPSNPFGNCLTCRSVIGPTLSKLPCLRYIISDAQLIDHDACPRPSWSRRWKKMEIVDIKDWCSPVIKTIHITQDVGGAFYKLKVREFNPIQGDALERKWVTNGETQSFKCAPYAIVNMKKAGHTLAKFAEEHLGAAICYYIDETDKLMRDTYSMTYRYSLYAEREDERNLLRCVLRLWCASRMESRSDRICSSETLGMEAQDYGPSCPNTGNILLPPVINAQMEIIVTVMILLPMKKAVLQGLQKLIEANRPGSWFAIYLCMFVLLHSCALLTAADNKRTKKFGTQGRYFQTSLIEGLHNGAKILLGHFHYCNKGSHPFTMDWTSPEVVERAGFNAEQAIFMQNTSEQIKKKALKFQKIRDEGIFEDEYYFLAQLYDRDWKPAHTI